MEPQRPRVMNRRPLLAAAAALAAGIALGRYLHLSVLYIIAAAALAPAAFVFRKKAALATIPVITSAESGLSDAEALTSVSAITRPPPKKVFIPTGNLSPAERIRLLTQGAAAKKGSDNVLEGPPDDIARKAAGFLAERRFLS